MIIWRRFGVAMGSLLHVENMAPYGVHSETNARICFSSQITSVYMYSQGRAVEWAFKMVCMADT